MSDAPHDPGPFTGRCLLFDLESTVAAEGHERIFALGAELGEQTVVRRGRFELGEALAAVDRLAEGADLLLGHNLLGHDLPLLRRLAPELGLHRLPVIDTLYLSPLAHPENPYHKLVKDYKLVRHARNDPLADARLAGRLFADQWDALAKQAAQHPTTTALQAWCLAPLDGTEGTARVLRSLVDAPLDGGRQVLDHLAERFGDELCLHALENVGAELLDPATRDAPEVRVPWAYLTAWLGVAGGGSVLPPWVRRRWSRIRHHLDALREMPCNDPTCGYCTRHHDPVTLLKRYFAFEGFRADPRPKTGLEEDRAPGPGLQERAVRAALAGRPHLVILPTGGGKSIGYQLPAIVRHLRRGVLTVVISPLQALMKDQVDNLEATTGHQGVAALYGLLTPPERGQVLEGVRLGSIALLYVSPEQLRNMSFRRAIEQREIGGWVFDEAHCLSKWGHDFRPDYLYAARFIYQLAKRQGLPIPPVAAFTATAKVEVKAEILGHFEQILGQRLEVFEAPGVGRDELRFEIVAEGPARKLPFIAERLIRTLPWLDGRTPPPEDESEDGLEGGPPKGCAVVYFSSRRRTEEGAEYLVAQGIAAEVFHAGLPLVRKRDVLDRFLRGEVPVVCATNAFGMGIDKDDVRLVIHADIPGSLEAYLQEAGRAGRDRHTADCVLIFDDHDIETQFKLSASSRITRRDIAEILRAVRRARRDPDGNVILTSGELLRDEAIETGFGSGDHQADTKVKTALAWLERGGFLEREENQTQVFQGKPKVDSVEQAKKRLDALALPRAERQRWLAILEALIGAEPDQGLTADQLAELPSVSWTEGSRGESPMTLGQRVLHILHQMAEVGLVSRGISLSAFLRPRGPRKAVVELAEICRLENALLALLAELEPDADAEDWLELSLRPINQRLVDEGLPANPTLLRRLLQSLAADPEPTGAGSAGGRSLELAYRARDRYRLRVHRGWREIGGRARERQTLAEAVLDQLLSKAGDERSKVLVEIASDELTEALRRDLRLALDDPWKAAERALLFLHQHGVIQLQKGLAVFRQAMTLRTRPEAKGRGYRAGDYAPLERHYGERVFQVHVMARYARLGLETLEEALELAQEYFRQSRDAFVERWFADDAETLERATDGASFQRIVDALGNPEQIALVAAPRDANLLVLAGPGSGKTRVVVHRAAYLLRVERVPARSLLVLCFNRHAALEVRRRLVELVGDDARGVLVQTYHGLAMRLTGTSFVPNGETGERTEPDFSRLIPDAIRLLKGEAELPGLDGDTLRDRLLAGFSHILVDEYQDIDEDQYTLVSALAGRTEGDPDRRLAILAVGDDDQTIYGWNGAKVEFIRRFRKDYEAPAHHLVQCYRSTGHILAAANTLIAHNRDRMKIEHPIRVDEARRAQPLGGRWAKLDPRDGGRVTVLEVADAGEETAAMANRWLELRRLDPDLSWDRCAVLARGRATLEAVRSVCEAERIPLRWTLDRGSFPSLLRLREVMLFLEPLRQDRHRAWSAPELARHLDRLAGEGRDANPWWRLLSEGLTDWRDEVGEEPVPAGRLIEYLAESLVERRRETTLGSGVRLLTVHGAKGLEFDHVMVAGDWRDVRQPSELEEERRLYYVAMTRARETLHLFERRGPESATNPHSRLQGGPSVVRRRAEVPPPREDLLARRHQLLAPADIFIDYAGRQVEGHPIHRRLAALVPGQRLGLHPRGESIELLDSPDSEAGRPIAHLSNAAVTTWRPRLEQLDSVRLVALIERRAEDCEPPFRQRLRCERWYYPLVEVGWRTPHTKST